ncbi:hypothetical protein OG302_04125 [Streptomyces sp. NBC_01283]|nr:hypothetical protein OG302_04125 [Streptomyces sp. NBC_01283]
MQVPDDMAAIAYKGVESTPTWLMIPILLLIVIGILLAWRESRNK